MDIAAARGYFDDELLVMGELIFSAVVRDCDGTRLRVQLNTGDTRIAASYNFSIDALSDFARGLGAVQRGQQPRVGLDDEDESFKLVVAASSRCNGSALMAGEFFIPLISVDSKSRYTPSGTESSQWISAVVGSGVRVLFSRLKADADNVAAFQRGFRQFQD